MRDAPEAFTHGTSRAHRAPGAVTLLLALVLAAGLLGTTGSAQAQPVSSARVASTSLATTVAAAAPGDRVIIRRGDTRPIVRGLKARLVQLKLLSLPFNGRFGLNGMKAVKKFQRKYGFKATGLVDVRTWQKLLKVTRFPTAQERSGKVPPPPPPPRVPGLYTQALGRLDGRCLTGVALCVDKRSRTMQWVVNGTARWAADVRFGGSGTPTREGLFTVYRKSRDHVSSIYHTPMPFAMFFSGGQAVHYSPDFASHGYNGASHGCVNVRDYQGIAALFDQIAIGTKVVVYWS